MCSKQEVKEIVVEENFKFYLKLQKTIHKTSPETIERINKSEKIMTDKIDKLNEKANETNVAIAGLPELIMDKIKDEFVSQDSFKPVQRLAYGGAGIILSGVVYALVELLRK